MSAPSTIDPRGAPEPGEAEFDREVLLHERAVSTAEFDLALARKRLEDLKRNRVSWIQWFAAMRKLNARA